MARKVVASPEAMMQSLFWPEVDLRDAQEFTIKKYSQYQAIRPKFLFKNEISGDITALPSDIPLDLKDSEFVQGMIYYFNGRTQKPNSAQVFPFVLMLTTIPWPPSIYFCSLNSGAMRWSPWLKVTATEVTQ